MAFDRPSDRVGGWAFRRRKGGGIDATPYLGNGGEEVVRDLVVERAAEEGGEPVPVRVVHRGLDLLYVICD